MSALRNSWIRDFAAGGALSEDQFHRLVDKVLAGHGGVVALARLQAHKQASCRRHRRLKRHLHPYSVAAAGALLQELHVQIAQQPFRVPFRGYGPFRQADPADVLHGAPHAGRAAGLLFLGQAEATPARRRVTAAKGYFHREVNGRLGIRCANAILGDADVQPVMGPPLQAQASTGVSPAGAVARLPAGQRRFHAYRVGGRQAETEFRALQGAFFVCPAGPSIRASRWWVENS